MSPLTLFRSSFYFHFILHDKIVFQHGHSNSPPVRFDYLPTPCSGVLLEKLTGSQPVKKFPAFYGTRRFINAFTSAQHLSLSWARSIQSIAPHPTSWSSSLILSSHLFLGLPSGLFLSVLPTKAPYTPLLFPICAMCPVHLILPDFITHTILVGEYRSYSFWLCRCSLINILFLCSTVNYIL